MPKPSIPPIIRFTARFYDGILSSEIMLKPNNIRQILALVIFLAAVALTLTIVSRTQRAKGDGETPTGLSRNIGVALEKIRYTETKNGVKQWDLTAEKVDYDRNGEVARLTGVRMVFPAGGKLGNVTVTARKADYFQKTRDVKLAGDVLVRSDSGTTFATGRADYLAAPFMIRTDDRVRYEDGRLSVEGTGMEFMLETRNVRVLHGVDARIRPGAGK